MLSQNFDEGLNEFSGELDAEKLKEFVAKAARPNMFEFSDKVQGASKEHKFKSPRTKKTKYFSLK